MKPLIVLISVFALTAIISHFTTGGWTLTLAGNLAMCLMLFLTALGHVMFIKGMVMMMPPFIPFKKALVYITGIIEVALGLALLFPDLRACAGYILIVFFILILPSNIYGAIKHINLEKADDTGPGLTYLWFRAPEQLLFIGWVYCFAVR